jgi:TetR/AcrR family transcriptional regulator
MPRGRTKVANPETARRILAAAEAHFAAQGMAGARTEEIALAAHANKAMLYYYFGDKRRLHRAVLENLLRQLRKNVYGGPERPKATARDKLLHFVGAYFDFLATHPNYPRLVQRAAIEATKQFEWMKREYMRPFVNRLISLVEAGIESGEFRRVDPKHTAFTIMGMTTSYFAAAPIFSAVVGHDLLAPDAVRERRVALMDFLEYALISTKTRAKATNPKTTKPKVSTR